MITDRILIRALWAGLAAGVLTLGFAMVLAPKSVLAQQACEMGDLAFVHATVTAGGGEVLAEIDYDGGQLGDKLIIYTYNRDRLNAILLKNGCVVFTAHVVDLLRPIGPPPPKLPPAAPDTPA